MAVKLIRQRLEQAETTELVEGVDFRTIIRTAAERGRIRDPAAWFLDPEKRNINAHTYDETKALDVVGHLPASSPPSKTYWPLVPMPGVDLEPTNLVWSERPCADASTRMFECSCSAPAPMLSRLTCRGRPETVGFRTSERSLAAPIWFRPAMSPFSGVAASRHDQAHACRPK